MSQDSPALNIIIPQAEFDDLSDGGYKLHFTRDVEDASKKRLEVWAYKPLEGSKEVRQLKTVVDKAALEVKLIVPLTALLSGKGEITYQLSYLRVEDKLPNSDPDAEPTPINKASLLASFVAGDSLSLSISKRAATIVESQSYKINLASNTVAEVSTTTLSWADKPWTVGFENAIKVRPIILRGSLEGKDLSVAYFGSWWIKGKGRLSLPQQDKVSIWFESTVNDKESSIDEEDFSEPKELVMGRGKPYTVPFKDGEWGPQDPPAGQ